MPRNLRKFDRDSPSEEIKKFFKDADAFFKSNPTANEYRDPGQKYTLINPALFERAESYFAQSSNDIEYTEGDFKLIKIETGTDKAGKKIYDIIAFKPKEELGKGGFGVVFIGHDKDGNRCAVKQEVFLTTASETIDKAKEREILTTLGKYKGYIEYPKDRHYTLGYLVSRLEEGQQLYLYFNDKKKGKLGELTICEQLIVALQTTYDVYLMHQQGIIHGDIKLENFIALETPSQRIGNEITITSIDHGISKKLAKGQQKITETVVKGTDDYMAPELLSSRSFSFASDIYALGKIFIFTNFYLSFANPMIAFAMCADNPQHRPDALAVMLQIVNSLKKMPYNELNSKAIELISICEIQINTEIKKRNQEIKKDNQKFINLFSPKKPLISPLKTFKEEKIDEIISTFKAETKLEPNNPILVILNNPENDADQKAIALKGYLLKQLSELKALQDSSELKEFFELQESSSVTELTGLKKVSALLENPTFIAQSNLQPEQISEIKKMIRTIENIDHISRKAKFVGELGSIEIYNNMSGISGNEVLVQFQRKPGGAPQQPKRDDDHSLRHS